VSIGAWELVSESVGVLGVDREDFKVQLELLLMSLIHFIERRQMKR